MGFFYSFVSLNAEQSAQRRHSLDRYGQIAQLSALIPLLAVYVFYLIPHISRKTGFAIFGSAHKEHQSPRVSTFQQAASGTWKLRWRRLNWTLDEEVLGGWGRWGTKKEWAIAVLWSLWLLVLVIKDTGDGRCSFLGLRILDFLYLQF